MNFAMILCQVIRMSDILRARKDCRASVKGIENVNEILLEYMKACEDAQCFFIDELPLVDRYFQFTELDVEGNFFSHFVGKL